MTPPLADDEYCESCGAAIDEPHVTTGTTASSTAAVVAAVSDRGLVHDRNEDAFLIDAGDGWVVAVVCDGVSSSAAPHVAARVAAASAGDVVVAVLGRAPTPPSDGTALVSRALRAGDAAVRDVPWMATTGRDAPSCTVVIAAWDGAVVTSAGPATAGPTGSTPEGHDA